MCVLICANPTVHLWLNAIAAHAEREALQAAGRCSPTHDGFTSERETLSESAVQQIPRGQMLREPYWPRGEDGYRDPLFETWKYSFDALANAWCRLLVLVGLRR
jgi:hypothetical protein